MGGRFRKLAWAALLVGAGLQASSPAPAPQAEPPKDVRPWADEDDLDFEDEFEGEGWGFWGF